MGLFEGGPHGPINPHPALRLWRAARCRDHPDPRPDAAGVSTGERVGLSEVWTGVVDVKKIFREIAEHAIMSYQIFESESTMSEEDSQRRAIEYITSDDYRAGFPIVVCLCGSTRFWREFQRAGLAETMAGRIVLSIGAASGTDDEHFGNLPREEYDRVKAMLDALHLRKIELADEVLILNVDGYIGESTRRELNYARQLDKVIRWLEPDKAE